MKAPPLVEARSVWKRYGETVVLERLDLSIRDGEFCVAVGASGCGKTTLLRMLLGEETPDQGQLLFAGQPLLAEPDRARGIVFQRYSVFPHLTVLGNVLLGLEIGHGVFGRLFGAARRRAREVALAMLRRVGLEAAATRYPQQLSGGMQQRLALAQSLVAKPRLLLLDEPFGALDPGIRHDMHDLVRELWREQRLTVLMVTHDLKEGFALGTRLFVLDKVRNDPQGPHAWGSRITYDIPLDKPGSTAVTPTARRLAS